MSNNQNNDSLKIPMGQNGYNTHSYFPTSGPRAYTQGGSTSIKTPGYTFNTRANLGLNAGLGGDVPIYCTHILGEDECTGDSSCTWDGRFCKNTFQDLQSNNYSVDGYLEQQFQNGTMGAPYIRDQYRKKSHGSSPSTETFNGDFVQDKVEETKTVGNFGTKENVAPVRENLTRTENKNRGDIIGALRGAVTININTDGYCPSRQISKTLGGGQNYSSSAINGVRGNENDIFSIETRNQ